MRTIKIILILLFAVCGARKASTQNESPSFQEMYQRMLELQRQMFEQLQGSPFDDPNFAMPRMDTSFYFRFDTTFEGGNISQFFHFSPFGSDSTMTNGMRGFNFFFDPFADPDSAFGAPDLGIYEFPQDDGDRPPSDDNLLPEEKLRQQEKQKKEKQKEPAQKPDELKPDPRIKTIRI